MKTIGEKLKEARQNKGLKQSDVAPKVGCAPTSLTNWENGKVNPSFDVLSKLCSIYEISPLSLLDKEYEYSDIATIAGKPVPERSYEEQLALTFSEPILARLLISAAEKKRAEKTERTAAFIQSTDLLNRSGGEMAQADIDAIMEEYEKHGGADVDILFAFHTLNKGGKAAFLSMLAGLLSDSGNLEPLHGHIKEAQSFTMNNLLKYREVIKEG